MYELYIGMLIGILIGLLGNKPYRLGVKKLMMGAWELIDKASKPKKKEEPKVLKETEISLD